MVLDLCVLVVLLRLRHMALILSKSVRILLYPSYFIV